MRISALYVYPVKGARGSTPAAWQLDDFGLQFDRRWLVVDAAGRFVTPREHPALALVDTDLQRERLVVSVGPAAVELPLQQAAGAAVQVSVWGDTVQAVDTGADVAALLSAHLGFPARLVHMSADTHRQVDEEYGRAGDRVSFADAFPLLLIARASLDELNRRLAQPLPMVRFRPNVVVEGTTPHDEDTWRRVRLGSVACDVVKPCARCVVTTLDPATAAAGREPLRTLARYRRWNGQVWFGQNLIHRAAGVLRVGDTVTVLETGAARPPLPG